MNGNGRPSLDTRGIVTIAILGALGGALSTFVGYLGNLVNISLGVPFGAGQFMAGLHVFWLVLMRVIASRRGVGTAGGLLKGLVEFFIGSTHGIVIVLVSLVQGIIIDLLPDLDEKPLRSALGSRIVWWIGAGLSSASNVFVLQAVYFSGVDILYILLISVLAFCSGVIFAGYFAWETLEFLNDSGVIAGQLPSLRSSPHSSSRRTLFLRNVPAVIFILFMLIGTTYYAAYGSRFLSDPSSCEVTGLVASPYQYYPADFEDRLVTIEAELNGAYTYIPLANYTGVLLSVIVTHATPHTGAESILVMARDGYSVTFSLSSILEDDKLLLIEEGDSLRLIAGNYDGSYWVRWVTSIQVY